MSQKKQEIKLPPVVKIFVDQKTNARTLAIPFKLPDYSSAVLMVTRLKDEQWEPEKLIKSIVIHYI